MLMMYNHCLFSIDGTMMGGLMGRKDFDVSMGTAETNNTMEEVDRLLAALREFTGK